MPITSTSTSSSTSALTASSATEKPSTSTTTANAAEAFTSQNDKKKPTNRFDVIGFNKSASVLRWRIEECHPNQTLFAPLSMAKDLTKIQFSLYNEIKAELQAVKNHLLPFHLMQRRMKLLKKLT